MSTAKDSGELASLRATRAGAHRREAILDAAMRLTTVEGLEGLSIARLAEELGMSKSGLYAHFRSKEELQLATIETAVARYTEAVMDPALAAPPGRRRLLTLSDAYFDLIGSGEFPGGCFFSYTSLDPALGRAAVRARLAAEQRAWLGFIEQLVREALELGELPEGTAPAHLAFEIDAIFTGADSNFVLLEDRSFLEQGGESIRRLLGASGA